MLLLAILVQLVPEAHVRDSDLDSGVEPFLEGVLLELTRLHLGALWSADLSGEFKTQLTRAFALNLSVMLSSRLEQDNQSQSIDLVQKELERLVLPEVESNSDRVRAIFRAPDAAGARSAADELAAQTTGVVVGQFAAQRTGMNTVFTASHIEWGQENMQAFCNAAVLLCQPFAACSPVDATADSNRTAATLVEMFSARYSKHEDFSIAVPTTLVAAEVVAGHPGALVRADTLRATWGMAPLSPPATSSRTEEAPETIVLHYPTVAAHTQDGAVEWARRASSAEASLLWLVLGASRVVDVFEPLHSRHHPSGTTGRHRATARDVIQPPPLTAATLGAMSTVTQKVRTALTSAAGTAMSRVLSAAMFAHAAAQSEHPHERYLYLWLSIEALFGGLEHDTEGVAIGARVAYRCALMLDPATLHSGRSHGQFRWGITMELQGLYWLRNATVHSGLHAPVVNKWLERRWRTFVAAAARRTMVAILEDGANTIEEILAFRESRFPTGLTIT